MDNIQPSHLWDDDWSNTPISKPVRVVNVFGWTLFSPKHRCRYSIPLRQYIVYMTFISRSSAVSERNQFLVSNLCMPAETLKHRVPSISRAVPTRRGLYLGTSSRLMLWGTIRLPGGRAWIVIRPMACLKSCTASGPACTLRSVLLQRPKACERRLVSTTPSTIGGTGTFQLLSINSASIIGLPARKTRSTPAPWKGLPFRGIQVSGVKYKNSWDAFDVLWKHNAAHWPCVSQGTRPKQRLCTRIARNLQDQSKWIPTKFAFFQCYRISGGLFRRWWPYHKKKNALRNFDASRGFVGLQRIPWMSVSCV